MRRGVVGNENIPITGRVGSRILRFNLSKGDKIRLTTNDYQLGLANGDTATVKEILSSDGDLPKLILERQNGHEIELDLNSYSDSQNTTFIAHSYA
jgi:ATP-dependent exoDNAse (exonuclease V) alpha subunit